MAGIGDPQEIVITGFSWQLWDQGTTLMFDVTRDRNAYSIHVTEYQHEPVDVTIELNVSDGAPYETVDGIFSGEFDLYEHVVPPLEPGEVRQYSWYCDITLHFNLAEDETIRDLLVQGELLGLRQFVESQLP